MIAGSLEVRLFNPLTTPTENGLHLADWPEAAFRPQWVHPVDFESNPKGEPQPIDQPIPLLPKQILTLRLT